MLGLAKWGDQPPCPALPQVGSAPPPRFYRGAGARPFVTEACYTANITSGITMSPRWRPAAHGLHGYRPAQARRRRAAAQRHHRPRVTTTMCRWVRLSPPRHRRCKGSPQAGWQRRRRGGRRRHRGRGAGGAAGAGGGGGGASWPHGRGLPALRPRSRGWER